MQILDNIRTDHGILVEGRQGIHAFRSIVIYDGHQDTPIVSDTRSSSGILPSNTINEGLVAGQRIAKISVVTLISIGIAEILMGQVSGSVVATADGIDSLSDALISFIVLVGLRMAHKPADRKFHFGYQKVESFAALMAAIGMVAIGVFILFHSYEALLHPREIQQPVLTMLVLAAAGGISLHRAFQMNTIANKYSLLSLKTDAKNSIKDGSASIIGFISVLIASQFGFLQMDAIGGMIIAGYIFSVSYVSLKQSSLILVDSWQNPRITDAVRKIVEEKFKEESVAVKSVLLRPSGMLAQAEIHLEIDGEKKLADVELLLIRMELAIRSQIPVIGRISSIPHSRKASKSEQPRRFSIFERRGATSTSS
ncbi:MAG: cation diffusion facilitator family transporter [Nitrososphaera sp.]|nr:cation diffusion facilitator family transporter [Nitrososphaera sp.]